MRLAVDLSISGIAVLRGSSSGVASLTAPGALVNDGDSITVGFGTLMGYPGRFTNLSGVATDNQAVAGETMATMNTNYSTVIAPIYNALSYNTLLMSAGTNDIGTASTGPGVTDAQLEVTVQSYASKARATGYKIWLTTIMPRNDTTVAWDATKEGYRVAYNTWLKANWASFADGLIDWTLIPETADPNSATYYQDKLHPTDALQQIMGAYLQTRMGGVTRSAPIPITTPIIGTATFNTGNKEFTTTATTTTVRGTTALSGKTCFCGELEVYPGADAVPDCAWQHLPAGRENHIRMWPPRDTRRPKRSLFRLAQKCMFVTVVAILCHLVLGQSVCVEEIVTDSNMTEGLSLSDCMSGSQAPIAKWKDEHPTYHSAEWSIGRYKCVLGHYQIRDQA
jgi:hypothetical protein